MVIKTDDTLDSDVQKSLLRQYQDMVDETNIVSKTDTKGIITYVNSKFIKVSGYTEEELIGQPHSMVRDPNMPSKVFKELWDTIQSKETWHGIVTNKSKDGSRYTVKASVFPILNQDGEIIEYISIRHDITELQRLNNRLNEIDRYRTIQESQAKEKLEAGIRNELDPTEYEVIYKPSDIVSGDFYSMYKMKNGATFLYIVDGQGHGISPALTVFAISSLLNHAISKIESLGELIEKLYPSVKKFLGDSEQLSYTMLLISPDKKSLSYTCGGMYPFLIKTKDKVHRIKSNNTPFMNFSVLPNLDIVDIDGWESIMLYSDGIVEHRDESLKEHTPEQMIQEPASISKTLEKISSHKFEDDVTLIYLRNL